MSPQTVSIIPFNRSDIPLLAPAHLTYSLTLPPNRFMWTSWPDISAQKAHINAQLSREFEGAKNGKCEMWKIVEGGKVRGMLVLSWQRAGLGEEREEEQREMPKGANAAFRKAFGCMVGEIAKQVEGKECLVLESIFIAPDAQSQGLGSRLLEFTLDKARKAKLPVFVVSAPVSVKFYKKFGFVEGIGGEIDLRDWTREGKEGKEGWGVYGLLGMWWYADEAEEKLRAEDWSLV